MPTLSARIAAKAECGQREDRRVFSGPLAVDDALARVESWRERHQAEVHSHDTDFARIAGLRWVDPFVEE